MTKDNETIIQIESFKLFFEKQNIHKDIQKNILRNSLLRSARFSSKIENVDTKLEIDNLYQAYRFITSKKCPKTISVSLIKNLHKKIINKIISNPGSFRTEPCAIYNTAGVAIYIAPPALKINQLINDLIQNYNSNKDHCLIKAAIFQFKFEKIHPFLDGNGRIGRLISYLIMYQNGYSFNGYLSPEEYLSQYREIYYDSLESNQNYQPFVNFFLESILNQIKFSYHQLNHPDNLNNLLPRRREIYHTIKDHPNCTFNFIHRRFFNINPKTIHYDLFKLQKENLIVKAGVSRGVTYTVK